MKKNGFTLIELLAAIIILGIISIIVFPMVDRTIKNQKSKLYDRQIDTIVEAGRGWAVKNASLLPEDTTKVYVGINVLVTGGYLENGNIKNPETSEEINGCVIVTYNSSYQQYNYEFVDLATTLDSSCNINTICNLYDNITTCN